MDTRRAARGAAVALLLLSCACGKTDEPPAEEPKPPRDLFLIELSAPGQWQAHGAPTNLTRREGYDDQPAFLPDGQSLLYVSKEAGQADIYRYDLADGSRARLMDTPEREYGPLPLPDGGFSAVRIDDDWNMQLWRFDATGDNPQRLLPAEDKVYYYTWADPETVAVHTFERRPKLVLSGLSDGRIESEYLDDNIGRCLQRVPGTNVLSFLGKFSTDEWWIKLLDLETRRIRRLVRGLPGQEDFAWTPDGALLMAHGSKIFRWREGQGRGWEDWEQVADFASAGLARITRIAVGPGGDRVVVVSEREAAAGS